MSQFRKIVESNLAKYGHKLEEDAEKDYKLIKEAEVIWDKLINEIKINIEDALMSINKLEYIEYLIRDKYNNLLIKIFSDKNNKILGRYRKSNIIEIYLKDILYNTRYKKYFINHNVTEDILINTLKLPQVKSVFLHEYQHYKYDNDIKNKNLNYNINSNQKDDYNAYRKNHNENNSFTIQDLNHLITSFKHMLKSNNIDINNKKEITTYLTKYINILFTCNRLDYHTPFTNTIFNYDGHTYKPLSNQPKYIKNTHMEKQYYKRIYNILYYLFVEGNINKAKQIYNEIKKDFTLE